MCLPLTNQSLFDRIAKCLPKATLRVYALPTKKFGFNIKKCIFLITMKEPCFNSLNRLG